MGNRIEHVLSHQQLNTNQLCAIHLDVMSKTASKQREFLKRVPYDCPSCPWAGRYPHLGPGFVDDEVRAGQTTNQRLSFKALGGTQSSSFEAQA